MVGVVDVVEVLVAVNVGSFVDEGLLLIEGIYIWPTDVDVALIGPS
jgi:hypothetical protein